MSQQQFLPIVEGVAITTDKEGRFNLNALHKASGLRESKEPNKWLALKSTNELITELEATARSCGSSINKQKGGANPGTFAHELLAISYAGWISPKFQLLVNQVFLDYKTGKLTHKDDVFDVLIKVDRIKDPTLKRLAKERANELYDLNIPLMPENAYSAELLAFWDVYHEIGDAVLNHSRQPDTIAINLAHLREEAALRDIELPVYNQLARILRSDKQLYRNTAVNSVLWNKSVRCWIFKRD
uniref:KilA domain protein n=1 Tax=Marinomonas sp. (strain MWYL1) TaxID=400668 RepID=A6VSR7_MARMS